MSATRAWLLLDEIARRMWDLSIAGLIDHFAEFDFHPLQDEVA